MKLINIGKCDWTFYVRLFDKHQFVLYTPYIQFSLKDGVQWKPICKNIINSNCWIYGWLFIFVGYLKTTLDDLEVNREK